MSDATEPLARRGADRESHASGATARLEDFIGKRRLGARVLRLPAPMPTVAAAARQMQVPPASIAKTLVFTDDDAIVVAVAPGDRRVLPQRLAEAVGTDVLRMAHRDDVLRCTGYPPGAVAPIAFLQTVHVVVDRALLAHQRVLAGAGEYDLLLDIAVTDIVACNRAVIAPITKEMET